MCQAPAALHHKIIIPHAAQGHFWVHDICVNPQNSLGRVRYDNFVMQRGWCLAHRLVASKFTPLNARRLACPRSKVQGPRSKARVLHVHTSTLVARGLRSAVCGLRGPWCTSTLVARGLWSEVCGLWSEGSVVRGLWSKSICGFTTFVVGAW